MAFTDKISSFLMSLGQSVASAVKVAILSRPVVRAHRGESGEIVVLGNGPSLRKLLDGDRHELEGRDTMAVNFAANAPEFASLSPRHYILADPHFFRSEGSDPNVDRLWHTLAGSRWSMTLHVPAGRRGDCRVKEFLARKEHTLATFNLTPGEGFGPWRRTLYRLRLAMPRPRNVMIPAIMQAIATGYSRIFLAGADHTWSRTLSVDDRNRVISVQPHFYKDDAKERDRVNTEYSGYCLHDILRSLYVAFHSYHMIADYARIRNVEIINITPGSFIDAFPRHIASREQE